MSDEMEMSAILAEQVDRLFASRVDSKVLSSSEAGAFPADLWDATAQLGLAGAVVSEDAGGAGLGWTNLEATLKSIGYHAAPVPLAETIIACWALGAAGMGVPGGILIPIDATLDCGNDGTVSGVAANVPWATEAAQFVAVAHDGNRRLVCLLDAGAASIESTSSIGRDPRGNVTFRNCRTSTMADAPETLETGLRPALAAVRSAQIAGALSRALQMAIEHANTRVQFGKPIGKFQALQQIMAEFACEVAAADMAAALALRSLDTGGSEHAIAVAKIRCGLAATKGAAAAHALHGAIGVTEEHSLHYLTRRLWQWRDDAGSEHEWAEKLGREVLSRPGSELWQLVVSIS